MTKKKSPSKAEVQHAINLILGTQEDTMKKHYESESFRSVVTNLDDLAKAIRQQAVRRAWDSRRKQFGQSGYVAGSHPKAGTKVATTAPVYTDEEKKARRTDAVKRAWAKRKVLFGSSGYKCGFSPNWVKMTAAK